MGTTASEEKLIQYLNEAYSKEKELETALEAHIPLATRATYKKRLQQHLQETKRHGRDVERRIKQLGGNGTGEIAATVQATAAKALALAQGPLHAVRGTSEDANSPPLAGRSEEIGRSPGACPPSNEGGLQGGRSESAPSLDSTVDTPLESPLGKGGTI